MEIGNIGPTSNNGDLGAPLPAVPAKKDEPAREVFKGKESNEILAKRGSIANRGPSAGKMQTIAAKAFGFPNDLKKKEFPPTGRRSEELLKSKNLASFIAIRGNEDPNRKNEEILNIFKDLSAKWIGQHKAGVVNFDLKLENVLLDNGKPLIADSLYMRKVGTSVDSCFGHPGYISPEFINAEEGKGFKVTPKNEMWIVGVMMAIATRGYNFCDWSGQFVEEFENVTDPKGLELAVKACFPNFDNTEHLDHAIAKCLSYDPQNRMSSEELHQFLQKPGLLSGINAK